MRKVSFLIWSLALPFGSCRKPATPGAAFAADFRMTTPFTQPAVHEGQLYLSNGRLRAEFGSLVTVYIVSQHKGWQMFPDLKQYLDVGEKQVSTYLPPLTNGSPCPKSERPADCKMLRKEVLGGRQSTKWLLVNQHGEPVYLWTDDQLGIALRWEIENTTYEVSGIREAKIADDMFSLPAGYSQAPESWRRALGSTPN
jgi:hypothetical protein